jgi:hypothetical protein
MMTGSSHTIDWEQRRYEMAKDFLAALLTNESVLREVAISSNTGGAVSAAVAFADKMIVALRT